MIILFPKLIVSTTLHWQSSITVHSPSEVIQAVDMIATALEITIGVVNCETTIMNGSCRKKSPIASIALFDLSLIYEMLSRLGNI